MSRDKDNIEQFEVLQLNKFLRNHLLEVVSDREEHLIKEVVREYKAGTLTAQKLFGVSGEFTALRTLFDSVDRNIRKGNQLLGEGYGKETEEAS